MSRFRHHYLDLSKRRGRVLRLALLAGLVVGGVVLPGAVANANQAAPTDSSSFTGAANRLVLAPKRDAISLKAPVRAAFQVPRGGSLRIMLNDRVVKRRFPRTKTHATTLLTQRDGLRYGRNTLLVTAVRGGQRVRVESRSFTLSRPAAGVARLSLLRTASGSRSSVIQVRVATAALPSPRGSSGAFARALGQLRRPRHFRAWVNGRDVTRFFSAPQRSAWTGHLSATHGLRRGANRLRVLVVDLVNGRHAVFTRTIRLPRKTPVAGAGTDRQVLVGARLRFSAATSNLTSPRRGVRYRWQLVERPEDSQAVLRGASSARPSIVADRPGRYRARLTVSEAPGSRAVTRVGARSSSDVVAVTAQPKARLIDGVNTMAQDASGTWGIQIGGTFYPKTLPNNRVEGQYMQVLVLDRQTLQPTGDGNWSVDHESGIGVLLEHVKSYSSEELVILAAAPEDSFPVQPAGVGDWNNVVNILGGSPFTANQVTKNGASLSIIGVPYASLGSAFQTATPDAAAGGPCPSYSSGPNGACPAPLTGSFIASGSFYAFGPRYLSFDTSASQTPTSNTMTVGVVPYAASWASGTPVTGLIHLVALDNSTLTVRVNQAFATNGYAGADGLDLGHLAQALANAVLRKDVVFVQSIGSVQAPGSQLDHAGSDISTWWNTIATNLKALGGSLPIVNALHGSYALVGGVGLAPDEAQETASILPSLPNGSTGHLRGHLTVNRVGNYYAVLADRTQNGNLGLYDVIHQQPTPWPLTETGDAEDQTAYQAAMTYVTNELGFQSYGSDIRDAYVGDDDFDFTTKDTALANLPYPSGPNPGFTADQLDKLKAQLNTEFGWLTNVKDLMDGYQQPFLLTQGSEAVNLQTLGDDIKIAIEPPPQKPNIAFNVLMGIAGAVLGAVAPFAEPAAQAALSVVTSAISIASAAAQEGDGGTPLPDRITLKVDDLAKTVGDSYAANATAINALRDVVVSDYGKLAKMAAASTDKNWANNSDTISDAVPALTSGAQRSFYGALFPLAYWPVWIYDSTNLPNGHCNIFPAQKVGEPTTGWTLATTSYAPPPDKKFASPAVPEQQLWAFGQGFGLAWTAPPASITDPILTPLGEKTRPDGKDGLGFSLPQFMSKYFPQPTYNDKNNTFGWGGCH